MKEGIAIEVPTIGMRVFVRSRPGRDHNTRLRSQYGQELVSIEAMDFEAGWYMDADYRPPDLSKLDPRKIEKFERFLAENEVIETANVRVRMDGHISFRDGRHRVRVLLNLGMESIPVSMTTECREMCERYYETSS